MSANSNSFFGITKTAEGDTVREEDIPIDIQYTKLMGWLLSRKLVSRGWIGDSQALARRKEKLTEEVRRLDLPQLVGEERRKEVPMDVAYVEVVETFEALLKCDAVDSSKRLLGGYKSELLRSWSALVDDYRTQRVHLAECAEALLEVAKYGVPSTRREVEKCQKRVAQLDAKSDKAKRDATTFRNQFKAQCEEMGIAGDNILQELLELVGKLPQEFERLVSTLQSLRLNDAVSLYRTFLRYTQGRGEESGAEEREPCAALAYLLEHGNTSQWQFDCAVNPEKWASLSAAERAAVEEHAERAKEHGAEKERSPADDNVNNNNDDGEDDGIDWGDDDLDLDVDLDLDAADAQDYLADIQLVTEEGEADVGAAGGASDGQDDAPSVEKAKAAATQSLLEAKESRNEVYNDLYEVGAFVDLRYFESSRKIESMAQIADAVDCPQDLRDYASSATLLALKNDLDAALRSIESEAITRLLEIQVSRNYVERLAASVRQKLSVAEQLQQSLTDLAASRRKELERIGALRAELQQAVKHARYLRDFIEKEISLLFDGRRVNLTGDVKNL